MQLPVKTKKAKKTVTAKLVHSHQNAPIKKPTKRRIHKSVVRSKPEYDGWYFSDADLHTIAHSNLENYISRCQPDQREMATQTSVTCKPANLKKAPSEDKAVQIKLSEKEVKNSFNKQHKDRGDSPVALSALINYKCASGDFQLKTPQDKLQPASEYIKKLCFEPQSKADRKFKLPECHPQSNFDDLTDKFDWKSKETHGLKMTEFDDVTQPPFSNKLQHSKSKNLIKELLERESNCHPQTGVTKPDMKGRKKYDKKHRPYKIDNQTRLPRKSLEISLKKETEARKSLKIENEGLKNCISKAEEKVKDMRSSLAELSNTIRTYKAKSSLPYVARVEKLERLVDDLIREFHSSSKIKTQVCESPKTPAHRQDIRANYAVISTGPEDKGAEEVEPEQYCVRYDDVKKADSEDDIVNWSNLSSISSGIVSQGMTVSSVTSSLTVLKKELGKFFENMREDTEKLIEEAQLHREVLLSYSERTSSVPTYDSTSTVSTR